jgi:glucosamine-6-phosphate deaminase
VSLSVGGPDNSCIVAHLCGKLPPQPIKISEAKRRVILKVFPSKIQLAEAAASRAAEILERSIAESGNVRIIAATGASQFEFLKALIERPGLDWRRVEMFHLDEYVGLPVSHPASFRKYLRERLIEPAGIEKYHLLDGEADPIETCRRTGELLNAAPIDVAFVGIGENGHLAFNDPPADFETEEAYIVVNLDDACRRQQVGEGWFAGLDEVPKHAISMTVKQILRAREIICIVPDARKAEAVKNCFEREISPQFPASILRTHEKTTVYLDTQSSSLLSPDSYEI